MANINREFSEMWTAKEGHYFFRGHSPSLLTQHVGNPFQISAFRGNTQTLDTRTTFLDSEHTQH